MNACPFGVPRYNWESARPAIQKCNLCHPRTLEGKKPGCVEVCPTEATIFGERKELLAEARRRLHAEPGRYIHRIWGEHEVGGTSVLYLADIDLGFLGWKADLGNHPLPQLTWDILTKMPAVFLGIGGLLAAVYWLGERKNKIQAETREDIGSKEGRKR
jgi:formate dehydrogenase iron-sulfur subunit